MQLEALFSSPRVDCCDWRVGRSRQSAVRVVCLARSDRVHRQDIPGQPELPDRPRSMPAYAIMAELPEEPDVAVFCLGKRAGFSGPLSRRAEPWDSRGAVIYDGGLSRNRAKTGRQLQGKIEGICREADIALVWSQLYGRASTRIIPALPILARSGATWAGLAGNVGIVSQSGGFLH